MKLPFTPMGSQVEELARRKREHPLPTEPCTHDCRPCCEARYCLLSYEEAQTTAGRASTATDVSL